MLQQRQFRYELVSCDSLGGDVGVHRLLIVDPSAVHSYNNKNNTINNINAICYYTVDVTIHIAPTGSTKRVL